MVSEAQDGIPVGEFVLLYNPDTGTTDSVWQYHPFTDIGHGGLQFPQPSYWDVIMMEPGELA
jgi:hypothetical protein